VNVARPSPEYCEMKGNGSGTVRIRDQPWSWCHHSRNDSQRQSGPREISKIPSSLVCSPGGIRTNNAHHLAMPTSDVTDKISYSNRMSSSVLATCDQSSEMAGTNGFQKWCYLVGAVLCEQLSGRLRVSACGQVAQRDQTVAGFRPAAMNPASKPSRPTTR